MSSKGIQGVKLSVIKGITRDLSVNVDIIGTTIDIKYMPGKFTPRFEEKIREVIEKGQLEGEVVSEEDGKVKNYTVCIITELLSSWSILDDEGIQIPISYDNVSMVPYPVIREIFDAISVDMQPKKKNSSD